MNEASFDVIIVGGSYSGLAAGMALGRALKRVLIIDDGKPCNRQTPYSHNFLTNDGKAPGDIAAMAKEQVRVYETVQFFDGTALEANKTEGGFEIRVHTGKMFSAKKIIFATGIKDLLPEIEGLADSWGISVLHCPYCHGYEVRDKATVVLGDRESAFDFTKLISNWTTDLTLLTNGESMLTDAHRKKLASHSIKVVEKEIARMEHDNGYIRSVIFKDGTRFFADAVYAPSPFEQHCKIPALLGCELTGEGYIKTGNFHETTVPGVYAIGDCSSKMRTVANAVATGASAGMIISKQLILEEFSV